MAATTIRTGEEGYDGIWADWVTNGRPSQFDRIRDDYGGELIRVIGREAAYPDFYRVCSLKAATFDPEKDSVSWRGSWSAMNEDYDRMEVILNTTDPGQPAVRRLRYKPCPNTLS